MRLSWENRSIWIKPGCDDRTCSGSNKGEIRRRPRCSFDLPHSMLSGPTISQPKGSVSVIFRPQFSALQQINPGLRRFLKLGVCIFLNKSVRPEREENRRLYRAWIAIGCMYILVEIMVHRNLVVHEGASIPAIVRQYRDLYWNAALPL